MDIRDIYEEEKVIRNSVATIRILRPVLTPEEREHRMKAVYKAAEEILKEVERKQCLQQ